MESVAGTKPAHGGRFAFLLGAGECLRPIYDEVLLETHGCLVAPTLGSILANWLLIVPRTPVINFARWQAGGGAQPCDLVQAILTKYDIAGSRVIWFEHGPSEAGSSTGCGVDQAHLHVIVDAPFSFHDFVSGATEASQLVWQKGTARTAHQSVNPWESYLVAASMDRAVVAQKVESVGSQYFRRMIADLVHQPDVWNYRTHPHLDNVWQTIRTFSVSITYVPPDDDAGSPHVVPEPTASASPEFKVPGVKSSDYTDGRPPGDWESKYPKPARSCINQEACLLAALLFLMTLLSGVLLGLSGQSLQVPITWLATQPDVTVPILNIDFRLLMIFSVGSLGGTTFSIKWLVHAAAKRSWHLDRRYWRLFVPLIGGVYACVVLALLDGGVIGAQN